ncbi:MAG TPA: DUF2460 domain-containing protein [Candidatus Acidoferrales bacterium]
MAFFEVEFPRNIGYKRLGSPAGFSTTVNQGFSGQEQRNRNWANSRGKWTIDLQTPPPSQFSGTRQAYIDALLAFFEVVGGRADAFRLKDHLDYQWTVAQTLGVGNGSTTVFQLTKTYTIGGRSYVRNITKPVWNTINDYLGNALAQSVTIALNGTPTAAFTLDATTGLVTMNAAPGNGVVVSSPTGQFHYPVRFDTDDLPFQVEDSNVHGGQPIISLHGVQLLEVLPPNY